MSNGAKLFVGALSVLLILGFLFPVPTPHVSLAPEPLFTIAGFTVTNTILASWVTIVVLGIFFGAATRRLELVPGRLQGLAESLLEAGLSLCEGIAGRQNGRKFFPVVMSIFLFVFFSNWLGLFPGYLTLGVARSEEHGAVFQVTQAAGVPVAVVPLRPVAAAPEAEHEAAAERTAEGGGISRMLLDPFLRGANTDLNMTLALAVVAMFFVELWGIQALGAATYAGKFFNIKGGPLGLYVGLVELISEVARVISFTFRLFGNIFAGEVLLGVVGFLVPWVAVLPFFGLELFVGFIQAFVFAILTLVFAVTAVTSHAEHEHEEHAGSPAAH